MYRIFIIEDDPGIARGIQKQMESWNLEARCASDFEKIMRNFLTITLIWSCWIFLCLFTMAITGARRSEDFPGAGDLYLFRLR